MSEEQIASLLSKAPQPLPPEGLLDRLERDLSKTLQKPKHSFWPWLIIERWWPLAACLVLSITIFARQYETIITLRRANESLRSEAASAEAEWHRAQVADKGSEVEIERLRAQQAEVQALTAEIGALRKSLAESARTKAENEKLMNALNLPMTQPGAAEELERAYSQKCLNNLRNIALAGAIFASDNDGKLPHDFLTITNELSTPRILVCPADSAHVPQNFESFGWKEYIGGNEANNSYQMLTADAPFARPSQPDAKRIFVRCPIHGHIALIDGEVIRGEGNPMIVQKDGQWILETK